MTSGYGRFMASHVTQHRVRFHELDPYDHVNHAMYVTYFEIGRVDALEAIGLGLDQLKVQGFQFVITKLEVRFRQAAGAGELLEIHTSVSSFGRASTVWAQEIRRPAIDSADSAGDLVATAEVTVAVTGADGKPTRPPPEMFDTLRQLSAE